jgi:hypothetical protein
MRVFLSFLLFAIDALIFWTPPAPKLEPWILRVYEVRQDARANQRCKPATPLVATVYSQVTVAADGSVVYRESIACQGPAEDGPLGKWPAQGNPNDIYSAQLSASEFENLISFLNTDEVKELNSFLNAAPITDNYEIRIRRDTEEQHISVTAFMPSHYELKQKPALTQLICRAKKIAGRALHSEEIPDYCKLNAVKD